MQKILVKGIIIFTALMANTTTPAPESASCDMNAYKKVIAACFTGRAEGFDLPDNSNYAIYSGGMTESWNHGPYDSAYKGEPFTSSGDKVNPKISILPPYMWGAISQLCDPTFDPITHPKCESDMKKLLFSPILNARYSQDQFYWRAHGHNCHDAVEDVGMCLLNASKRMPSNCGFETKVIVWDGEADIKKALGNSYHSQLLVKRMIQTSPETQEPMVCLAESQVTYPSGDFHKSCCTKNLALFDHGTAEEYFTAFDNCPVMYMMLYRVYPHHYDVSTFREQRQTGQMDISNTYNRQAGVSVLNQEKVPALSGSVPIPRIVGMAYDKNGVPLALNIR